MYHNTTKGNSMRKLYILLLLSPFLLANELNILSPRALNAELVALFERQNNVKIVQTNDKLDSLIQKAKSTGDVFITSDISNIYKAKDAKIFSSTSSKTLQELVPEHLRDGVIYSFAKRARIVAYNKKSKKTDKNLVKSYEDLAKPELKGKILMRSANAPYSITLLASIIANDGEKKAKEWAKGVFDNLAVQPEGGDRNQAKQVFEGKAEFAIMNTYYIGLLINSDKKDDKKVGNALQIIFPNQDSRGAHINIAAMAMIKKSKNKELAQSFMEFMLSKEAQQIIMNSSYQFPVRNDIELNPIVKAFGSFKEDKTPISKIAKNIQKAKAIYKELGFE